MTPVFRETSAAEPMSARETSFWIAHIDIGALAAFPRWHFLILTLSAGLARVSFLMKKL